MISSPIENLIQLTDIAHTGRAVGRAADGRAIFVEYALPGERAFVEITWQEKRYALGRARHIESPSPARVPPPCDHFGVCGGCQWQMMAYPAQLDYKRTIVRDQLTRVGGLPDAQVHPVIAAPEPYHYRTHVTFHVTPDGRLAFVASDDRALLPITFCHIMRPPLVQLFDHIRTMDFSGWERVRLQAGSADDDVLIALTDARGTTSTRLRDAVRYTVRGKSFRATGGSFFQVNLDQAGVLVDLVMAHIGASVGHAVDLYSGVGLFTAFLAQRAARVTSIESDARAVRDAQHNLAAYRHVIAHAASVDDSLPDRIACADLIVLDPPRAGVDAPALDALIRLNAPKIVYVSCDPSTLARDAKKLVMGGYTLIDVQPVDMFPHTFHIETVTVFAKE